MLLPIPLDIATRRKHYASLALYVVAIPLAQFHPYLALAAISSVTIVWIVPTARVKPAETANQSLIAAKIPRGHIPHPPDLLHCP
jgi:hypothetical protein